MCGGGTLCSRGEGSWLFCFGPEKTQRREKSGMKNFEIPIFLTVAQDKPYKIPVTYFLNKSGMIFVRRKSQVETS